MLQVVGRRVDISLLGPWNGREPATRIVAIGAAGSIDAEDLRRRFDGRVGT
ncbi:MAG: GTP-binding protein [Chloroflexota bacterium]